MPTRTIWRKRCEKCWTFQSRTRWLRRQTKKKSASTNLIRRAGSGARGCQRSQAPGNQIRPRNRAHGFSLAAPADQVDTAQPRAQRDQVNRSRQRDYRDSPGGNLQTRIRSGTGSPRHRTRYRSRHGRAGIQTLRSAFALEYPQAPRNGPGMAVVQRNAEVLGAKIIVKAALRRAPCSIVVIPIAAQAPTLLVQSARKLPPLDGQSFVSPNPFLTGTKSRILSFSYYDVQGFPLAVGNGSAV